VRERNPVGKPGGTVKAGSGGYPSRWAAQLSEVVPSGG
jgi:hypothetical protein